MLRLLGGCKGGAKKQQATCAAPWAPGVALVRRGLHTGAAPATGAVAGGAGGHCAAREAVRRGLTARTAPAAPCGISAKQGGYWSAAGGRRACTGARRGCLRAARRMHAGTRGRRRCSVPATLCGREYHAAGREGGRAVRAVRAAGRGGGQRRARAAHLGGAGNGSGDAHLGISVGPILCFCYCSGWPIQTLLQGGRHHSRAPG
jgi:hypothetical protein